ncbi:MAG: hypothetical protein U5P41_14415 [Gammaproteobacteria bacterium]|nr:hypothetical protein [Gammaproteobacteria bacterium]
MSKNQTAFEKFRAFKTERKTRLEQLDKEIENLQSQAASLEDKYESAVVTAKDGELGKLENELRQAREKLATLEQRKNILANTGFARRDCQPDPGCGR